MLSFCLFLASEAPSADVRRFECGFLSNFPAENPCWLAASCPLWFLLNLTYVFTAALRTKPAGYGMLHTDEHYGTVMKLYNTVCKHMNPYCSLDWTVQAQHSSALPDPRKTPTQKLNPGSLHPGAGQRREVHFVSHLHFTDQSAPNQKRREVFFWLQLVNHSHRVR